MDNLMMDGPKPIRGDLAKPVGFGVGALPIMLATPYALAERMAAAASRRRGCGFRPAWRARIVRIARLEERDVAASGRG